MGFFSSLFGSNKPVTTTNTSTSNYDQEDNTVGAGDASIVAGHGGTVNQTSITNEVPDLAFVLGGEAIDANSRLAESALNTALGLSRETGDVLSRLSGDASRNLLATVDANAAAASANTRLADSLVDRSLSYGERLSGDVLSGARDALEFGDAASRRATDFSADALDGSLAFARVTNDKAFNFAGDSFAALVDVLGDAAKQSNEQATATRDFASQFVGDFYESQKSGDVQTLQKLTEVAGAVVAIVAIAWALKSAK